MGISVDPKALELMLKRVDVSITDITSKNLLPYKLYCRREKTENSQIKFLTEEGDDVISDIFHLRVTDCVDVIEFVARIPLYSEIDVKEKPLVKFTDGVCQELDETHMENGVTYCDIRISLRAGDTTIFAVYTIPRQEESTVNNSASTVQSKMDKEFKLNVPEGSFKGETTIALKVFKVDDVQGPKRKKIKTEDTSMSLLTDIYQINVDGNQPAKDIMVHFPAKNTLSEDDDVIVVTADENSLIDETSLKVVPAKPKLVNNSFVFTVSHFCIHVAVPKSLYNENPSEVLKQIKRARQRKKPAVLFVMVLEQSSQQHLAVAEVTTANMVQKRTDHWLSKGYKSQEVSESDSFMMEPCREFEIKFGGNVTPSSNDSDRRLAFLPRRASFQSFSVTVKDVDLSPVGNFTIMTVETDEEGRNSTSCLTVLPFKLPLPPKALVLNKKGTFDVANSEYKGPLLEYLKARFIEYPWIEKSDKPLKTKVISLLEQFKVTKPTNLLIKNIEQYAMNTLSEWKNQVYLNLLHNEGDTDTAALTLNDLCRYMFAGLLPTTADDRIDQAYMKFTIFVRCCAHQLDAFMISTHGNSRSSKTSLPVVFNPFWRDFQLFFDSNVNDKHEKGSIKTMEEIEIRRIERYKQNNYNQ